MTSPSFAGTSEFNVTSAVGALFRIASKIAAEVAPANACRPVAIS